MPENQKSPLTSTDFGIRYGDAAITRTRALLVPQHSTVFVYATVQFGRRLHDIYLARKRHIPSSTSRGGPCLQVAKNSGDDDRYSGRRQGQSRQSRP